MKHHLLGIKSHIVQAFYLAALLIGARIALACQHHGERVIIRPIYFGGVQLTLRRCQHQIKCLRTKTHHQHLALGIAKSDVIFHKPGLPVFDHQPCIKHALIRYTAPAHFGHRGADNLM